MQVKRTQHTGRTSILLIVGIGALALALRLLLVDYGLPHIYSTDEGFEVERALKLGAGAFEFHRVAKGGLFYILFIEYGFIYVFLRAFGTIASTQDFIYLYFSNPSVFWLPGRITSAAFGALACSLLIPLGKRAFQSYFVGVAAALLLAFHLDHIRSTISISVDAPAVAAVIASFLVMLWHQDPRANGQREYLLLALMLAFATMCRLQAALLILPALLFHVNNVGSQRERTNVRLRHYLTDSRLATFMLAGAAFYMAGNPGIVLYSADIARWILSSFIPSDIVQVADPEFPQLYERSDSKLLFYWRQLFPSHYLGVAFLFFSGLVLALRRPQFRELCLLSFALPFFLMLVVYRGEEHIYSRYLLPIVPIVWLYSAYGASRYIQLVRSRSRLVATAVSAAVIALSVPIVLDGVRYVTERNKPDTKTAAYAWFLENVDVGSTIYLEGTGTSASPMTVPLQMDPRRLAATSNATNPNVDFADARSMYFRQRMRYLESVPTFDLVPIYNTALLEDALNQGRGDYAVVRAAFLPPFDLKINQDRFPAAYRLVRWLHDDFTLVQTFAPGEKLQGPTLLVYKRTAYRGSSFSRLSDGGR